jgi:hypothetical protein
MPTSLILPSLEQCLGTSPIQAANSRPFLNYRPLAITGPMLGTLLTRRQNSLCQHSRTPAAASFPRRRAQHHPSRRRGRRAGEHDLPPGEAPGAELVSTRHGPRPSASVRALECVRAHLPTGVSAKLGLLLRAGDDAVSDSTAGLILKAPSSAASSSSGPASSVRSVAAAAPINRPTAPPSPTGPCRPLGAQRRPALFPNRFPARPQTPRDPALSQTLPPTSRTFPRNRAPERRGR